MSEMTRQEFVDEYGAPAMLARRVATFETLTAVDVHDDVQDVELADGSVVRVRGLTRYELQLNGKDDPSATLAEARTLHWCMVEPTLSIGQAEAWIRQCPAGGDVATVSRMIRELSGLGPGAAKSNV